MRYDTAGALALLKGVDEVYAAKGKKVVHLDLKGGKVSRDEIVAAIIGPSGNLRAPVLRRGRRLFVGFNEEAFAPLLR